MEHFTFQQFVVPARYDPVHAAAMAGLSQSFGPFIALGFGLSVDALFQGTGSPLPPAVISDYVYGIAAYSHWKSRCVVHSMMEDYRQEHYIGIPSIPSSSQSDDDGEIRHDPNDGGDDPDDLDFDPHMPGAAQWMLHKSTRAGDIRLKEMDELNVVLMMVQGITPQEAANRRGKQREEEELKVQEVSQRKVIEWRNTMDIGSL